MCLIIACPTGKKPSNEVIEHAYAQNRDGAGLAWFDADSKQIKWVKGLTLDKLKEKVAEMTSPFIIHCRIGTVGPKNDQLTHPFPVTPSVPLTLTGSAKAVLFHNGTFSGWKNALLNAIQLAKVKCPAGPWSDSRAMAYLVNAYGPEAIPILDDSSRYVVFQVEDDGKPSMAYYGTWVEHDDMAFSNRGSCAFHTAQNFTGGTGGATGPQQTGMTNHSPSSTTPGTTASETGTSAALALVQRSSRRGPAVPRTNYNPWRVLDATGSDVLVKTMSVHT